MANAGEEVPESTMNAIDIVKAVSQLWIPHFWPKNVAGWFTVVEVQFKSARIMSDEMKYNIVIANLQEKYMKQVEDVVLNPPATGRYELLKNELIKRTSQLYEMETECRISVPPIQASDINKDRVDRELRSRPSRPTPRYPYEVRDSYENLDPAKMWKLFEKEQMGNRTPSQFYEALKRLAIPSTPDNFLLAVWKLRLPTYMQQILAVENETDPNIVTKVADRIHEITAEAARLAMISKLRN